jgi:hypothetical protein
MNCLNSLGRDCIVGLASRVSKLARGHTQSIGLNFALGTKATDFCINDRAIYLLTTKT